MLITVNQYNVGDCKTVIGTTQIETAKIKTFVDNTGRSIVHQFFAPIAAHIREFGEIPEDLADIVSLKLIEDSGTPKAIIEWM